MKNNFITPVSMQVTKEQYEKDLEQPLLDLGYWGYDMVDGWYTVSYICTNYGNNNNRTTNLDYGYINKHNRYFIDHYNPELFLALAAQTKGTKPIVGEYMNVDGRLVKVECLEPIGGWFWGKNLIDSYMFGTEKNHHNPNFYNKATKEELINHFKMKKEEEFVLPEKWCIKGIHNDKPDNKILLDYFNKHGNDGWGISSENAFYYLVDNNTVRNYDLPNDYTEITFEQFKKWVLKESNLNQEKMKNRFPFSLQPADAQKIIEAACSSRQPKLADKWAKQIVLNHNIEIGEAFYKEMRKACTKEQHELFDKIFGKDVEECKFKVGDYIMYFKNTYFIEKIETSNMVELREISFKHGVCKRFLSVEDTNKHVKLWTVNDLEDGQAAWVKSHQNHEFRLRYSNGKGVFYTEQRKLGITIAFGNALPFDPQNLPVNTNKLW